MTAPTERALEKAWNWLVSRGLVFNTDDYESLALALDAERASAMMETVTAFLNEYTDALRNGVDLKGALDCAVEAISARAAALREAPHED